MKKLFRIIIIVVGVVIAFGLLIQLVPYGRNHTNPAVVNEPNWDSDSTRALAQRACFDCHSNETTWPWYSNIAPISWMVQHDVDEGRQVLNFSEWPQSGNPRGAGEIPEVISEGEMPPAVFLLMHPDARLSTAEKQQLISGMQKTLQ